MNLEQSFRDACVRMSYDRAQFEDKLIMRALDSLGMLDLAQHAIDMKSNRLKLLVARKAKVELEWRRYADGPYEYGDDVIVSIDGKEFARERVTFSLIP